MRCARCDREATFLKVIEEFSASSPTGKVVTGRTPLCDVHKVEESGEPEPIGPGWVSVQEAADRVEAGVGLDLATREPEERDVEIAGSLEALGLGAFGTGFVLVVSETGQRFAVMIQEVSR